MSWQSWMESPLQLGLAMARLRTTGTGRPGMWEMGGREATWIKYP